MQNKTRRTLTGPPGPVVCWILEVKYYPFEEIPEETVASRRAGF